MSPPAVDPAQVPAVASLPVAARRPLLQSRRLVVVTSVVAFVLFLVVSGVVLTHLFQSSEPSGANAQALQLPTPVATLPQSTAVLSPVAGATLAPGRAFGAGMLLQPQDALLLPGGGLALADTGHHRVVLLDGHGKLVKQITVGGSGPLRAPFSLALTPGHRLLVLDSDVGQIDEYTAGGKLVAYSDLGLHLGESRDIVVGSKGQIVVADPATNAIITLDAKFSLLATQPGTLGSGVVLFNQPCAVAVATDGTFYVLDSQSRRLLHFSTSWGMLQQWPISIPDTQHSPRLIVLSAGRVLATDPAHNALLVYDPSMTQPQSFPLSTGGEPLGLALDGHSAVLVTCMATNEVREVHIPGLTL